MKNIFSTLIMAGILLQGGAVMAEYPTVYIDLRDNTPDNKYSIVSMACGMDGSQDFTGPQVVTCKFTKDKGNMTVVKLQGNAYTTCEYVVLPENGISLYPSSKNTSTCASSVDGDTIRITAN